MTFRHSLSRALCASLTLLALASCSDGGASPSHESTADPRDVLDAAVADTSRSKSDPFGIGKHDKTISETEAVSYEASTEKRERKTSKNIIIRIDADSRVAEARGTLKATDAAGRPKERSQERLSYYDGSAKAPTAYYNDEGWHKTSRTPDGNAPFDVVPVDVPSFKRLKDLTITEVGQTYVITGKPHSDDGGNGSHTAGVVDSSKSMVSVTIDRKTKRIGSIESRIVVMRDGKRAFEAKKSLKYDWSPVDVAVPPEAKSASATPTTTPTAAATPTGLAPSSKAASANG